MLFAQQVIASLLSKPHWNQRMHHVTECHCTGKRCAAPTWNGSRQRHPPRNPCRHFGKFHCVRVAHRTQLRPRFGGQYLLGRGEAGLARHAKRFHRHWFGQSGFFTHRRHLRATPTPHRNPAHWTHAVWRHGGDGASHQRPHQQQRRPSFYPNFIGWPFLSASATRWAHWYFAKNWRRRRARPFAQSPWSLVATRVLPWLHHSHQCRNRYRPRVTGRYWLPDTLVGKHTQAQQNCTAWNLVIPRLAFEPSGFARHVQWQ